MGKYLLSVFLFFVSILVLFFLLLFGYTIGQLIPGIGTVLLWFLVILFTPYYLWKMLKWITRDRTVEEPEAGPASQPTHVPKGKRKYI